MDSSLMLLGQILIFGGDFAPRNCARCNGQLWEINQNEALFTLLGTTYGGDGRTTFGLPNMDDPRQGGIYIIATAGDYPQRD